MSCLIGLGVWFGSGSFWYGFSAWLGSFCILGLLSSRNRNDRAIIRELRKLGEEKKK